MKTLPAVSFPLIGRGLDQWRPFRRATVACMLASARQERRLTRGARGLYFIGGETEAACDVAIDTRIGCYT